MILLMCIMTPTLKFFMTSCSFKFKLFNHLCFLLVFQFRGRLLVPNMSGEPGPGAARIAHWLQPC